MTDFKTSLLIDKQVPQFIREDYPKFISFLEAYYEFLENEQFTNSVSQKNDLTTQIKKLRYLSDVDRSLDDFEDQFMNMYAPLIPMETEISKDFLLKNIYPLYNSKGSEKSFRLLFRMLFGEEITIKAPKNNILRCSDGKWKQEQIFRIDSIISSTYTGDNVSTEFYLTQEVESNEITVLIDDVVQTSGFLVKKEIKKIVFNIAPTSNSTIEIRYQNFDTSLLANRKITGITSNATAIIEKVNVRNISGDYYFQVYVDSKSINGTFINGEYLTCDIFADDNETLIDLQLLTLSQLRDIVIGNPGASYNIGDHVSIEGPATTEAVAIIDDVESGTITDVPVVYGGAGFKVTNNVLAENISNTSFYGEVIAVDTSGRNSLNSVTIYTDIISDYSNVVIGNTDYGFPVIGTENTNTAIINALSTITISSLGPITSINIETSLISSLTNIYVEPVNVTGNIKLNSIGILGRINIASSGSNYAIGEYLVFTNQPGDYSGRNANAVISNVSVTGGITQITINNGGEGYTQGYLPTITINTANGTNANLIATSIMGDGESLLGLLPRDANGDIVYAGQIKSIKIIDPGAGYEVVPFVDLTSKGNGQATANAFIRDTIETLTGKWTTSDSILSSDEMKIQGRDYYINFSYLISSQVEFKKYKKILRDLLHPAGMIDYCEYNITKELNTNVETSTFVSTTRSISGTVNTNSSIYVIGTNTKFVLSNTNGILIPGSNISINNQIRTVNAILSNTVLTVSNAYTFTANTQELTIIT